MVATGVLPHYDIPQPNCRAYQTGWSLIPPIINGLTVSGVDHVAVVGAGSSALETAALLHIEAGCEVQLVVRCPDSPLGDEGGIADTTDPAAEQQALRRVEVSALGIIQPPSACCRKVYELSKRELCWGLSGLGG